MPLNPEAAKMLEESRGKPRPSTQTVDQARAEMASRPRPAEDHPIASVMDCRFPAGGGWGGARLYRPLADGVPPVAVYFHGGGWVVGDLDSHDHLARSLCRESGCAVLAVDYRLAPEHPFPAAVEDAFAALNWVAGSPPELGVDGARLAVVGDSAGGNLAAAVALMARDRGGPAVAGQALLYPIADHNFDTVSYSENAEGYGLTRADMIWYWQLYLPSGDRDQPYASPLKAAVLRGLPPALVITAEYDVLRDEGEAYAARLREAGVPARLSRYPGMVHGFMANASITSERRRAIREAATALSGWLGTPAWATSS